MGTVVTIGNFDGIHLGHQALLNQTAEIAKARGLDSLALTFEPHPAQIHHPDSAPALLTGYQERLQQMRATGIGEVIVIPYTKEFAAQTDYEFVKNYLVDKFDTKVIVLGSDAKFGKGNSGDLASLRKMAPELGFEVIEFDAVGPDSGPRWSSSAAREAIQAGDIEAANGILGRSHSVTGVVVHGDHRGRTLGFPTANLAEIAGLVPPDGVYAGYLTVVGSELPMPAAISIGTNPTFTDQPERRVEAYVLDRTDLDLYGAEVRLEFAAKLRDTLKFDSVAELVKQMRNDVVRTREITAN